jgi:hypothetical protein
VTTLESALGHSVSIETVETSLASHFCDVFERAGVTSAEPDRWS